MLRVALQMLLGDKTKYITLVLGLAFASLLMNQQGAIFLGLLKQGFLERSNVEANREAMELQFAERQYQAIQDAMRRLGQVMP